MGIKIPIGIEDFTKMREGGYYYVDKTAFIKDLLSRQFEANLITRPRRFGKTLTMSMLADFFDIRRDSRTHFEGLEIAKETELCENWMNRWPVIFLSLKSIEGLTFQDAYGRLEVLLASVCKEYAFLYDSAKVDPADREIFNELRFRKADRWSVADSLVLLTRMMRAHYGKSVILLLDEYDVPLAKASEHGYYAEMMDLIRALLGGALKTNPHLEFAVVTGCLRISKESIFTGLNNLVVDSITGGGFNEYIGFSPEEVQNLLADAGLADHMEQVKEWYDGYRFGKAEIYCPWAVLNHVNALQTNPDAEPRAYWANTSHNGIIYQYISRRLKNVKADLNRLMDGEVLVTPIEENLTYDDLKSSPKNFWSLLYLSGYLTNADFPKDLPLGTYALRIPNKEVRIIFQDNILEWLNGYVETVDRTEMCRALWDGDTETAQRLLSALLLKTISFYDYKESYYHAFLAGLFAGDEVEVISNGEYGMGRPDLVVLDDETQSALVMEIKYAKSAEDISAKMKEAREQFWNRDYLAGVPDDYTEKTGYCVVFYKKKCRVERA